MKRPRLLFVTQDFPPEVGGIQTYSFELAKELAPRCAAFAVLAPWARGALRFDRALPFAIHRIPGNADALPYAALPAVSALAARGRYDCTLHAQWPTAAAGLLARRMGAVRRVAVSAHGRELLFSPFATQHGLGRAYDALRARVLRAADHVLAVSSYTAGLARRAGASPQHVAVIPNGTNPQHFRSFPREHARAKVGIRSERVLLTVARLVPRKGIETVLMALPALARRIPDLQYVVAGTGPDAHRLIEIARTLGVDSRVHFVGKVSENDLPLWYSACDVFVMPARSEPPDVEGFGLVFLEANACERPVVGARAGGVGDAILHERTGLLVTPGNVEELTEALLRLLLDADLARALGREGRRRVEDELSWQRVAERMLALLSA